MCTSGDRCVGVVDILGGPGVPCGASAVDAMSFVSAV